MVRRARRVLIAVASLAAAALTVACSGPRDAAPSAHEAGVDSTPPLDTGDMGAIRERGTIRFADVSRTRLEELPRLREGVPQARELANEFAMRLDLAPEMVEYPSDSAAAEGLLRGEVDVIVSRRGPGVDPPIAGTTLSAAFRSEPGVFVARAGEAPDSLPDLDGRRVAFAAGGSMLAVAEQLAAEHGDVIVDTIDTALEEDVIDHVLYGDEDLALTERWIADAIVEHNPQLETGMIFGRVTYAAAVRDSNPRLLESINDFVFEVLPVGEDAAVFLGDLGAIRDRRILRVLTVNGPSTYFLHRGEVAGYDYEFFRFFAEQQNLLVQMIVAPSVEELVPWLRRGLGDVIGAGVVPDALTDTSGIAFTASYHDVHPVIVTRPELMPLDLDDVGGRSVLVAPNNPFLPLLEARRDEYGYTLQFTSDEESTAQLFDRLVTGEADATLLESHLAEAELAHRDSALVIAQRLDGFPGRSWAVRADQPRLLEELQDFVRREGTGLTHNVLIRKYFNPETRSVEQPPMRPDGSLSPFDDLLRTHAATADLDWRLLAAQMFVESRFDPNARSHVGAVGLMQMMPETAKQVGIRDITDPEEQIRGGAAYMRWLGDRFPDDIEIADRLAFTMAAYNAGYGHVKDARRVAARMELDPDRWFENVELAMLALSDPDVYRSTTHGYTRGHEPVNYVRRIRALGQMYVRARPN